MGTKFPTLPNPLLCEWNGTIQNIFYLDFDFALSLAFLSSSPFSFSLSLSTFVALCREKNTFLDSNMQVMHTHTKCINISEKKASGGNVNDKVSVSLHYRATFLWLIDREAINFQFIKIHNSFMICYYWNGSQWKEQKVSCKCLHIFWTV